MKFTLSWLKDHLETDAPLDEIIEALNMIGLEVEEVDDRSQFSPFTIAKVVSAEQHPDADRLRVLMVDKGDGNQVEASACESQDGGECNQAGRPTQIEKRRCQDPGDQAQQGPKNRRQSGSREQRKGFTDCSTPGRDPTRGALVICYASKRAMVSIWCVLGN